MSNGHVDYSMLAASVGTSASEMASADAQAALAQALIESTVQFTGRGMREAVFIQVYAGQWGKDFVADVMAKKRHQTPGALKKIMESIKAMSLSEFMRGVNLNLGGK